MSSARSFCASTDNPNNGLDNIQQHPDDKSTDNPDDIQQHQAELSNADIEYRNLLKEAAHDDALLLELLKDKEIVEYVERQMEIDRFLAEENKRNSMRLDEAMSERNTDEFEEEEAENYEILSDDLPQKELKQVDNEFIAVLSKERILEILEENFAIDVCVVDIDKDRFPFDYVDHLIVVSGRSTRHIKQMASNVRFHFKQTSRDMGITQKIPLEGVDSTDWMAVDTGNCAIHFMLPETRARYELESLWINGPENDAQYQQMLLDEKLANELIDPELLRNHEDEKVEDEGEKVVVNRDPKLFPKTVKKQRAKFTRREPKVVQ